MNTGAALRHLQTDPIPALASSDQALITASRAGNSRAFEEIYRRYRKGIRDLCQRMLADAAKAEDVTQETFIRAYLRMHKFQEGKSLWPWLSTIAHHLCIDEIRGLRRAPASTEETKAEMEEVLTGDSTSDEAIARHERAQLRARLSSALASLPPPDRRVVFLRSVEEWTYEDIARTDGRTIDAVRNVAWRARTTLRSLLSGERERASISALGLIPIALSSIRSLIAKIWARVGRSSGAKLANGQILLTEHAMGIACLGAASVAFALIIFSNGISPASRPFFENSSPKRTAVMFAPDHFPKSTSKTIEKVEKRRKLRVKGRNDLVSYDVGTSKPRDGGILPPEEHADIIIFNPTEVGPRTIPVEYDGDCNNVGYQIPDTETIKSAC